MTLIDFILLFFFFLASMSEIQGQSAPADVSEAMMCSAPSPAPSSTISNTYIHSPSPSSPSMMQPKSERGMTMKQSPHAESFIQQGKLLKMLISSQNKRTTALTEFMNQVSSQGSTPSERSVKAEKEEFRREKEELQQRLLLQKEEHLREIMAMQEKHKADITELQQCLLQQKEKHLREIVTMQDQHKADIKELQEQHKNEIKEMLQQRLEQMENLLQRR